VIGTDGGSCRARLQGLDQECRLQCRQVLAAGQRVKVVLRPEDLVVSRQRPEEEAAVPWFEGVVEEIIYKGTTYDMGVLLHGGRTVLVTKFFDEDDEQMIATAGERIFVSWVAGWEVVFPDDEQEPL
jgi:spermidine/putrescine transport system ATP-binding protein